MIAMALSCNPQILIADEPTTALDVTTQQQILSLIAELQEKHGTAVLFITHDMGVVAEIADTVYVMKSGDLVAFRSSGAYGAVMASEYNTRPLIPEVMVNGDQFCVIRARPTFDEIIKRDIIPKWM